ncbi:hypothetical protein JVU11DRAFT_195 [Chiua virens]|nr:hypothetical protein JVU11DRAFT_195 [Chiua virens]
MFSAAVIMAIVYDYEVTPDHDRLVELFERAITLDVEGLMPETASIIEAFHFSEWFSWPRSHEITGDISVFSLPEWFPGDVFKRKAAIYQYSISTLGTHLGKVMGNSAPAVVFDLLKCIKGIDDPLQLQLLEDTCATAFTAGAGTVYLSTLQCFMLTMVQQPEVQKWAQAEIDAVVGTNRLPNFDDRPPGIELATLSRPFLWRY